MCSYGKNAILTAICLGMVAALAVAAVAADRGAYARMEGMTLAEKLAEMGMFELLEAHSAGMSDPAAVRYMLAKGKIARSKAPGLSAEQRNKLLDEARLAMDRMSVNGDLPDDPRQVLAFYRMHLELAEAMGLGRTKPYALRLMYLQGGQADRAKLDELTGRVLPRFAELSRELSYTAEDWRSDPKKLITVLSDLQAMQESLDYKSAWVRFYRGMSLPEGQKRRGMLNSALARAEKFASGDEASGVKHWSKLLMAMTLRELGDHIQAGQLLGQVVTARPGPAITVQAMFEIARNHVEDERFAQAQEAIGQFSRSAGELLGPSGRLQVDVKQAMLSNYLHERWALSLRDPKAAAVHRQMAQKVLLDFVETHRSSPGVSEAFLEIFATKYRDHKNLDDLNSIILLAVVSHERRGGTGESEATAEKLLRTILARNDETSLGVRSEAIWQLAMLMNARRQNLEAGRLFVQLAREHPQHHLAMDAARNAVYSFNGVLQARRRAKTLIAPNLRQEFIKALGVLLEGWPGRDDLLKWNFDLAWQLQKLASPDGYESMGRAVAAYDKVPADIPESMQARHLAIELRLKLLNGPPELSDAPGELLNMLNDYSYDAKRFAGDSSDAAYAMNLQQWGAISAFRAATLMYEKLDRKSDALRALKMIPSHWPDTDVLPAVWEFEISKLIEQEQTDLAIEKIDAFSRKHPDNARSLISLVVSQIRLRIEKMRGDDTRAAELANYQRIFYRFGEDVYAAALAKKLPPEKMYPIEQMRAEALLAGGKKSESLALFARCAQYDARQRAVATGKIDQQIDAQLEAISKASGSVSTTGHLASEYFQMITSSGGDVENVPEAIDLKAALVSLDRAEGSVQQIEMLALTTERLNRCYQKLRNMRKRAIPIDATNIRGLARANYAAANYTKALRYYSELIEGIDASQSPEFYWSTQLERCRCMLEAFKADKQQMKRLAILIRQLRLIDRTMGNMAGSFDAVLAKAENFSR